MGASQDYKGYKIVVNHGSGFEILREYRGKFFKLSGQNFHFTHADQALTRACNYIDKYPDKLEERFKSEFIQFCGEVYENPLHYWDKFPNIDVKYYLKAYKKLNNEV